MSDIGRVDTYGTDGVDYEVTEYRGYRLLRGYVTRGGVLRRSGVSAERGTEGLHTVSSILYSISYFTWYHAGLTADINVIFEIIFRRLLTLLTCICYDGFEGCECAEVGCGCS